MNKTEILERLFCSSTKVKIIKLFLFNPRDIFDKDIISARTKSSPSDMRRQLGILEKMRMIQGKSFFKEVLLEFLVLFFIFKFVIISEIKTHEPNSLVIKQEFFPTVFLRG